ncbi:MAG: hypothetical protein FWF01_03110 [Alphaproteobacteria bacterium]|nr:hypothetical protein [Alphaproteobacteria bacterium]
MKSVRRHSEDYGLWKRHISRFLYIAAVITVFYVAYDSIAGSKATDSATIVAAASVPVNRFNFANQPE